MGKGACITICALLLDCTLPLVSKICVPVCKILLRYLHVLIQLRSIVVFRGLLRPLARHDVSKLIEQRFVFVVSELTGIEIHTVVFTGFIPNVFLFRVGDLCHQLATARAVYVFNFIVFFTNFGVAAVNELRHPFALEDFSFTNIEPDTFTVYATIDGHIATVGDFFHRGVAFWTFHRAYLLLSLALVGAAQTLKVY
jgi:hypothetical protein